MNPVELALIELESAFAKTGKELVQRQLTPAELSLVARALANFGRQLDFFDSVLVDHEASLSAKELEEEPGVGDFT